MLSAIEDLEEAVKKLKATARAAEASDYRF